MHVSHISRMENTTVTSNFMSFHNCLKCNMNAFVIQICYSITSPLKVILVQTLRTVMVQENLVPLLWVCLWEEFS